MPSNIEIKARVSDPISAHRIAERLSGQPPQLLHQTDIFFDLPGARLKLRIFNEASGELILYRRADENRVRRSDYVIAPTSAPNELLNILRTILAVKGMVKKVRSLYLVGQTRIHMDKVEELGDFLEIEVVLRDGQPEAEGTEIAERLLRELGINKGDLQSKAYIDLLHS